MVFKILTLDEINNGVNGNRKEKWSNELSDMLKGQEEEAELAKENKKKY